MPLINTDTGEVWENWEYREDRIDAPKEKIGIRVSSTNGIFGPKNIGCYFKGGRKVPNISEQISIDPDRINALMNTPIEDMTGEPYIEHPEFGKMRQISNKRRFTQIFHTAKVRFTTDMYELYFYRIARFLEQDTNIVYIRDAHGRTRRCSSTTDIAVIAECSDRQARRFISESMKRGYIGIFMVRDTKWYIVNPHYAFNGNKIPLCIWKIFNRDKIEPPSQWIYELDIPVVKFNPQFYKQYQSGLASPHPKQPQQ